jgi:Arc/MetJ family transcription regulator
MTPNTPRRTIRVADELWAKAVKRAEDRGETVSEAVRKFLERYTR